MTTAIPHLVRTSLHPQQTPPWLGGRASARSAALAPPPSQLERTSTVSPLMGEVLTFVRRMAPIDITLTLLGETGTGKDVLAHAIHDASDRAPGPFVVFDCGAVPASLIESELFGHERGSFTGAHADHAGAFERASGGTLFLDEIGELPLDLQPRLLRALDQRAIRRVGGTRERQVDVRIVAATNRDLATLVGTRQFRDDLYFRLAAAVVRIPPLRERLEDLPLLVSCLLRDLGRHDVQVDPDTLAILRQQSWPGNIRELKNILTCALAFLEETRLEPRHLRLVPPPDEQSVLARLPLSNHTLDSIERAAIRQTLAHMHGNKVQAARVLGIAPSTLYEKLRKMGCD